MVKYHSGMMAHYTPCALTKNRPAPFYECLPPFARSTIKAELNAMANFFDPAFRDLSFDDRIRLFKHIQWNFYLARNRDVNLATSIDQALFARYTSMSPLDSRAYLPNAKPAVLTAENIGMFGRAGAGKSQSFDHCFARYPQFIQHSKYNGQTLETKKSVPILPIICPVGGGIKALADAISKRFCQITGTAEYPKARSNSHAEETIKAISDTGAVGMYGIDEVQNILHHGALKGSILGGFTFINRDCAVPLLFAGDETAMVTFENFLHAARRAAGVPTWTAMSNNPEYHEWFKEALKYTITKEPWPYTEELADYAHAYSMGLAGPVIRIILMAQQVALENKKEHVRKCDLEEAVKFRLDMLTGALANVRVQREKAAHNRKLLKNKNDAAKGKAVVAVPPLDLDQVRSLPPTPKFSHLEEKAA